MFNHTRSLLTIILVSLTIPFVVTALEPPPPGMVEQMISEGTYQLALENAEAIGNHKMSDPRMSGIDMGSHTPYEIVEMIQQNLGRSRQELTNSEISRATSTQNSWLDLDLNRDGFIDERDLLVLGHYQPKNSSAIPSTGTQNLLCLLIDFSDFPHLVSEEVIETALFGEGQPEDHYRGLHKFYSDSSNGMLNITGDVYGWYRAPEPRSFYTDDVDPIPLETAKLLRKELIEAALGQALLDGADFSDYDIDGDGEIEEFIVIWSGWKGNWASFWWGKHPIETGDTRPERDGFYFAGFSWQAEVNWSHDDPQPEAPIFESRTIIHETGHALGLPDYYDYNGSVGPDGGVGYLDMMSSFGDHNAFSKYILGWIIPQTITSDNLYKYELGRAIDTGDAVIFKANHDSNPFSEYFIIEHRRASGYDDFTSYYGDGLMVWHANASQTESEYDFDNSYTDLKLLRLVQADGLEEIEFGNHYGDPDDFWTTGMTFGPSTTPNSFSYDGGDYGGYCWINADNTSTINVDFVCHNNLKGIVVDPLGVPISGVNIAMSGVSTDEQTTGADGSFAWIGAMGGTYTITPTLAGFEFDPPSESLTITDANANLQFVAEGTDLPKFSGFNGLNDGDVYGSVVGEGIIALNVSVLDSENIEQLAYTLDISPLGAGAEDPSPVVSSTPGDGFQASFDLSHLGPRNYMLQLSGIGSKSGTPDGYPKAITLYLFNVLGDMNADGAVDNLDLAFLDAHLGVSQGAEGFVPFCDSDLSGTITEADATVIGYNWSGAFVPTYVASGHVMSDIGDPLGGVTLNFTGGIAPVITDSGGDWSQTGIPDGTYTVTPSLGGWDFAPAGASFTVSGEDETVPDFIGTGQSISFTASGHVEDDGGTAIEGVEISFSGGLTSVTTDSAGNWTLSGIPPGTYFATPALNGWDFTPVSAGFSGSSGNTTVEDLIGIWDPTTSEAWGWVNSHSTGGGLPGVTMSFTGGLPSVTTALGLPYGNWTRDGIPNGTYTVTPSLSGYVFNPLEQTFTVSGDYEYVPTFVGTIVVVYDEVENNDILLEANVIPITSFTGWTGHLGDEGYDGDSIDLTKFTANSTFDIEIDLLIIELAANFDLALMNSSGVTIASSEGSTPHEILAVSDLPSGTYYIGIVCKPGNNNGSDYTLDVEYTVENTYKAYGFVKDSLGLQIPGVTMSFTGGLFEVITDFSGYWERDGIPNGTYTVTPSFYDWTFTPTEREFTISDVDVALDNFIGSSD